MSDLSATGAASGLGQRLRQARLDRGLSIAELAAQLHMRPEQIEIFEEGQTARWPERAFAIAQVRRLATAIGLDADAVVAEVHPILDQVQRPSAAATAVMRASAARTGGAPPQRQRVFRSAPRSRRPAIAPLPWMLLPLGVLVIGIIVVAGQQSRRQPPKAIATVRTIAPRRAPMLEVSSQEPAWLTVRTMNADTVVFDGSLKGRHTFPLGRQGLELRSGRPDLVLVRQGDGPARPLGRIDRIIWVTFRPTGATAPTQPAP